MVGMALFHVNRYMGGSEPQESKSSADTLLQKLHSKAKAREEQRRHGIHTTSKSPGSDYKKKKNSNKHSIAQIDGALIQDSEKKSANVLKDKLKRSSDPQQGKHLETSDLEEDTLSSSPVEKVKKKKRKVVEIDSERHDADSTKHKTHKDDKNSERDAESVESPDKVKKKHKKDKIKKFKKAQVSEPSSSPQRNEENDELSSPKIRKKKKDKKTKSKGGDDSNVAADSDYEDVEQMELDVSVTKEEEEEKGLSDGDVQDKAEEDEEVGFTILGEVEGKSKKMKVKRVLPEWLSQPTVVEHDLTRNQVPVDDYTLISPKIASALKQNNITHLFPVQRHVIPLILDSIKFGLHAGNAGYRPRDLCVSAPTGSGKTLAFAVPIVQALHDRIVPRVRALIVLPTRDLATQVYRVVAMLCNAVNLRVALLGGQKAFVKEQEMLAKHNHSDGIQIDIVVATPGRLVDHINNTKGFVLEHLRFLVIDEADRMMEQIANDWISHVEKLAYPGESAPLGVASIMKARPKPGPVTPASCSQMQLPLQKLLFSATLSQNPEKLTHLNLFQPRLVTTLVTRGQSQRMRSKVHQQENAEDEVEEEKGEFVGKFTTPVGLTEYYIESSKGDKPLVIMHLMKRLYFRQVLCFTNTVEATHRLYLLLKIVGGINVAEFSSNLKSADRQQILRQFKAGKIDILICSDGMARGMDIDNVRFVISYSLPPYLKTYIHRVGRTARAGKSGIAFSLLQKAEVPKFRSMVKNAGKTGIEKHIVRPGDLEPLMLDYEDALDQLPHILKKENERS